MLLRISSAWTRCAACWIKRTNSVAIFSVCIDLAWRNPFVGRRPTTVDVVAMINWNREAASSPIHPCRLSPLAPPRSSSSSAGLSAASVSHPIFYLPPQFRHRVCRITMDRGWTKCLKCDCSNVRLGYSLQLRLVLALVLRHLNSLKRHSGVG